MRLVSLLVSPCYRHLTRYIGKWGDLGWGHPGKFSYSLLSMCHGADVEVMEEVEGVLYLPDHTALGHCHFSFYDKVLAVSCIRLH